MTRPRTNDTGAGNIAADSTGAAGKIAVVEGLLAEPLSNYGNCGRGLCGLGLFGGPMENYIGAPGTDL